jgi:drug/metabolite transporter (DMT)-like permease
VTRRKAEAALVWNTVIWGATFVVVKSALADISPLFFLALRFSLAALILLPLLARKAPGWSWRTAGAGALAGVFLFSGYVLQTLGLRLTSAPKSAFVTGLSSVMVPLLGALVYRTRPLISEVAGLLAATAGLVLMTLQGVRGGVSLGDVLTLFCAVGFAAHIVVLGHFSERMSFEVLAIMQVGAAALLSVCSFWWVERPHVQWRPAVIGAILITGLLATALAFTIQAWAQRYTTSVRTGLIYALEPVFAWITSFLLVGEGLSARAAAGAVLILGGVALVEVKPLNPRPHPSEYGIKGGLCDPRLRPEGVKEFP